MNRASNHYRCDNEKDDAREVVKEICERGRECGENCDLKSQQRAWCSMKCA